MVPVRRRGWFGKERSCLPALCLFLAVLSSSPAFAAPAFSLHTAGSYIVDSKGHRVRLNAVNWYGGESSDYVVAGLETASLQSIVRRIRDFGFNTVRLPWSNELYESNPLVVGSVLAANADLKGEHALAIMDRVVNALTGAGIMVILDNHNSDAEWCCSDDDGNTLWYNSRFPEASWLNDWKSMAQRYKDNPLVIGADLRNEPRGTASWGGSAATDWHAAAQRGANTILEVNPNMLIFVEGVNYALDLSGVSSQPVIVNVANRVVYSAHNYGFDHSATAGYDAFVSSITPKWGYLVTGANPQPLWIGEFGTCNTASTCVSSTSSKDNGYWFGFLTAYLETHGIDWCYWAVNGTQSSGKTRVYGSPETFGILNSSWNGSALTALTSRLQQLVNSSGRSADRRANIPANSR